MKDAMSSRLPITPADAQAQLAATRRAAAGRTSRALRQVRRHRGWSQKSLAHWLGISESYLGQIELGKRLPSANLCERMREWIESADLMPHHRVSGTFILDGRLVSDEEVDRVVRALVETV